MTADLVPPGSRLADIGTDHAHLPAALLQEGTIPRALVTDLRPGPLARARDTARRQGLEEKMDFRLCDGLEGVCPGEADAIVLAGMGGETIAGILGRCPWPREGHIPLILQPMSAQPELRSWLGEQGYTILREELAREGDLLYTAWLVLPGEMGPLTPAQRQVGRNRPHPLRQAWLECWLTRTETALAGLSRSARPDSLRRTRELEEVRRGILAMKEELLSWNL